MKKKLIAFNTTIMLGLGSVFVSPAAYAETPKSITDIQAERSHVQSEISDAEKVIQKLQNEITKKNNHLSQIKDSLNANSEKIEKTKKEISDTEQDIKSLKSDIADLEERIAKREEVLKERALSFQESGGDVNYLEVLLGSSSFRDLVDRVGAVATIVEADQDILDQQEADKAELESKKKSVEEKLAGLKEMQVELEGMQAQIKEQKAESLKMKKELKKKEKEAKALKIALENKDAGLEMRIADIREQLKKEEERKAAEEAALKQAAAEASNVSSASNASNASTKVSSPAQPENSSTSHNNTSSSKKEQAASASTNSSSKTASKPSSANVGSAITAGYKYIGNSTYEFGGGRTASDIANGRFDCSAFVAWAYRQAGVSLTPSTAAMVNEGQRVSASQMQPGDLVFFSPEGRTNGHVGIYVGNNKFIGSQSSTGVAIANMGSGYWANAFKGVVVRVK